MENKRDFLHVDDLSADEIKKILEGAKVLKKLFKERKEPKFFSGYSMAMLFAKPSARTRISFETGFARMGGHPIYLSPNDVGIGKREPIKDLARVLSGYNDLIMARLFDHNHIIELAEYASVPVINGLTDFNHPCQILADLFTIWEVRGSIDDLTVLYVGDGNNIVHSWLELAARIPIRFICASPEGYFPDRKRVEKTKEAGVSEVIITDDPYSQIEGVDVIYTDVWASMGQKDQIEERLKVFEPYRVTSEMLKATGRTDTIFMHCLPAERGREVTDEVIESKQSVVFQQAENRMHLQNSLICFIMDKEIKG